MDNPAFPPASTSRAPAFSERAPVHHHSDDAGGHTRLPSMCARVCALRVQVPLLRARPVLPARQTLPLPDFSWSSQPTFPGLVALP